MIPGSTGIDVKRGRIKMLHSAGLRWVCMQGSSRRHFPRPNERLRRVQPTVTRYSWTSLGFDELAVGDEWESPRRTLTEADVALFAGLSGDFNPLHVDHQAALASPFGRPIAHGLLGLSIATGLASHAPRVDTLAFVGILEWTFHSPIGFGDTIYVLSTIEALEPKANGRRGLVTWRRKVFNQHQLVVQEGRTQTLVRSQSTRKGDSGNAKDNGAAS
jgi:3-hydroxybutyryl-CoA dehydratase